MDLVGCVINSDLLGENEDRPFTRTVRSFEVTVSRRWDADPLT